jgi:hypothetical protein
VTLRRLVPWVLPLLAGILALRWVQVFIDAARPTDIIWVDWFAYALGAERVLRGESLYLAEQMVGPYHLPDVTPAGYIYPPPSAILFLPFAAGDLGRIAWLAANVGLFYSGLAAVLHREFGAVRPLAFALVLLGLLVTIPIPGGVAAPFPNGVLTANVNVALAGLLAWCWAAGDRRGWIPYAAGVGGVFKIFPAALVLWAARRDGWRPVAVAVAVAGAIAIATLPIVGLEEWRRFLTALSNAEPTCAGGRSSIACLSQPFVGTAFDTVVGVVVSVVLLAASLAVRAEYPAFVLLTAGMLAPLADGHHHYLLFVYVIVVIGIARFVATRLRTETAVPHAGPRPGVP